MKKESKERIEFCKKAVQITYHRNELLLENDHLKAKIEYLQKQLSVNNKYVEDLVKDKNFYRQLVDFQFKLFHIDKTDHNLKVIK